MITVNSRPQRKFTKTFEGTNIDWTTIENKISTWENLAQQGKELMLYITINYIEDSDAPSSRTDKRGKSSVTNAMLEARDSQIDAEHFSEQPSVWPDIYKMLRCPGSCSLDSQYCWLDPVGKKHYKLRTHHLKQLVRYVEKEAGVLETHDDVPDTIRQQLYREDELRHQKKKGLDYSIYSITGSTLPSININVLPSQSSQTLTPATLETTSVQIDSINIPDFLETAVEKYTDWHLSRVSTEVFRENIKNARNVTLDHCLDFKQIFQDQNPAFFVEKGVKIGAARRFVEDIMTWVKECKQAQDDGEDQLH